MEDIIAILQNLQEKQAKTISDLAENKQSLREKIEENFETMSSQLKTHRYLQHKMVEKTLAESEDEFKSSIAMTDIIVEELKQRNDASKKETELKDVNSDLKTVYAVERDNEFEELQSIPTKRACEKENMDIANPCYFDESKGHAKLDQLQYSAYFENLQHKSKSTVPSYGNPSKTETKFRGGKYSLKLSGTYSISSTDDNNMSDINSICCLDSGNVMLVDSKNECIKILDSDFKLIKVIGSTSAFSICHLQGDNFAMSSHGRLKYVYIDKNWNVQHSKDFSAGVNSWSLISSKTDHISKRVYIQCQNRKHPYYHIREYDHDGGTIWGSIEIPGQYMCLNSDESRLYVTRGISVLRKSDAVTVFEYIENRFEKSFKFSAPKLNMPCGMVVDKNEQVLVCGYESKNVFQFDKDGIKVGVLLEGDDALNGQKTLGYDKTNQRLIVAGNSDEIKVFDLNL